MIKIQLWIPLLNYFIITNILFHINIKLTTTSDNKYFNCVKMKTEHTNNNKTYETEYVTYLEALRQPVFSSPANVSSPDLTFINIALDIITNTKERQKVLFFLMKENT